MICSSLTEILFADLYPVGLQRAFEIDLGSAHKWMYGGWNLETEMWSKMGASISSRNPT